MTNLERYPSQRTPPEPARFRREQEPTDQIYAQALTEAGFSHLVPFFDPQFEKRFFEETARWALNPGRDRLPLLAFERRTSLWLTAPENLYGLYGRHPDFPDQRQIVTMTFLGKKLWQILDRYNHFHPETPLYLFCIDGLALEDVQFKPYWKRWPMPLASSFHPKAVKHGASHAKTHPEYLEKFPRQFAQKPPFDLDLMLVLSGVTRALGLRLEGLLRYFNLDAPESTRAPGHPSYGRAEVETSKRRPGFQYLVVRTVGTMSSGHGYRSTAPVILGQIAPPENYKEYGFGNRSIHQALARGCLPMVLAVPYLDKEKEAFWGVGIDFFPECTGFPAIYVKQRGKLRRLEPLFFLFPEITFLLEPWPEKLDHFLHLFRTLPWADLYPLIAADFYPGAKAEFLRLLRERNSDLYRRFSQLSSEWLFKKIVRPIAARPENLGNSNQRASQAEAFWESIKAALDGDPFFSLIRMCPIGYTYPDTQTWGMGIVSEEGFLPSLWNFLTEKRQSINEKRINILHWKMEAIPKEQVDVGWRVFMDFLLQENNGDLLKVAQLLTPTFYPYTPLKFAQEVLAKIDPNFERFRRITNRQKILTVLEDAEGPLTAMAIAERTKIPVGSVQQVLKLMNQNGEVAKLGGERRPKSKPGTGTGGFRPKWVLSEDADQYFEPGTREAVLTAIKNGHDNIPAITKATGLKEPTVRLRIKMLYEEGTINIQRVHHPVAQFGQGSLPSLIISLVGTDE